MWRPVTRLQKSTMQEDTVKRVPRHHLQGVSNGALFLLQTPNSGVMAFGHGGCNTTTPEPWPPRSCLVCRSPYYLWNKKCLLKGHGYREINKLPVSGWKNIKGGYNQNPSLLLIGFKSSLHTQEKLSRASRVSFSALPDVQLYTWDIGPCLKATHNPQVPCHLQAAPTAPTPRQHGSRHLLTQGTRGLTLYA